VKAWWAALGLLWAVPAAVAQVAAPPQPAEAVGDDPSAPQWNLQDVERRLAARPDSLGLHLERIGTLYVVAVDAPSRIEDGLRAIDSTAVRFGAAGGAPLDARLRGYRGAFITLRAKHAFWPHHKLRHVREGLAVLDEAVAASPDDAVVRYLRLVSGYYLPALFGRRDAVRADFRRLARLLPDARADFPGAMYATVVRFVLDHGALPPDERRPLERLLARHG
jgi:hypothetical protein